MFAKTAKELTAEWERHRDKEFEKAIGEGLTPPAALKKAEERTASAYKAKADFHRKYEYCDMREDYVLRPGMTEHDPRDYDL